MAEVKKVPEIDEWLLCTNWLKLNKRLGEQYRREKQLEAEKAEKCLRVKNLKAIWDKM